MSFLIDGCACSGTLYNMGMLSCVPQATRDAYKIYVPYYDSTGAINKIPAGTVLNQAFIVGKLNEDDPSKRWYITPKIEANEATPPEMETESIGNQTFMTGEEIKQPETFEHVRKTANPALLAFYNSAGCQELGEFSISRTGQLKGVNDGEVNFQTIKLQDGSLNAVYSKPMQGQSQKVMVSRTDDELENDAFLDFIDASQIAYSALLWPALTPIEIIPYIVSKTTSAIVFLLQSMGSVGYKSPITGIVTADIVSTSTDDTGKVYNVTEEADSAGTLTYDATLKQYTFTYSVAVASEDEVILAIKKSRYHMKPTSIITD